MEGNDSLNLIRFCPNVWNLKKMGVWARTTGIKFMGFIANIFVWPKKWEVKKLDYR